MEGPPPAKKAKVPKVARVKNKMPAEVQITAEQLLQEASATKVRGGRPGLMCCQLSLYYSLSLFHILVHVHLLIIF